MIRSSKSKIHNELSNEDMKYFFDYKDNKFLHNIDTFYYTVKLNNDFRRSSSDQAAVMLRNFFELEDKFIPGTEEYNLYYRNFTYSRYYNINLVCPDYFDIFIAPYVPDDEFGESPEIVVQIRSNLLWSMGVQAAFEYSYKCIVSLCSFFELSIKEVKENRTDFCWHSNYLQNPTKFFNIENYKDMRVTTLGNKTQYIYTHLPDGEVDTSYIALGKRSEKCFLRIYNKTREVVEMGYKPWFLKEWLFNGLISRYDFYVLEKSIIKKNWNYTYTARLEFYSEYGTNEEYKQICSDIVSGKINKDVKYISELANSLTPALTIITNVEFQVMRKMSKNFALVDLHDYTKFGPCSRIYKFFENHSLITEYLTRVTFRLVDPDTNDRKSRCEMCPFWLALRRCKLIDVKNISKKVKLHREYTSKISKEILSYRAISSMQSLSLYEKGINNDSMMEDLNNLINVLNDNDIHKYNLAHKKAQKISVMKNQIQYIKAPSGFKDLHIINMKTGKIY